MKNFTFIFLLLANFSLFAQNTYVPDDNFEQALIDLGYDSGDLDDYVPTAIISGLAYLDVSSKSINDLTGIEDFVALTVLACSSNELSSLDVSENTALIVLDCKSNELGSFDVRNGNNANLTYFNATGNSDLSCIYVDDNTASYSTWFKDETATYVNDEAGCTIANSTYVPDDNFEQALIDLGYDSGDLDDYVLTANISGLTSLGVSLKSISDLTGIEDFVALTILKCRENQLSSLDVSANTALEYLDCYSNQLSSLDVSANTALETLICGSNQLSSLDVSANKALTSLACYSNELSSLDVSTNIALIYLWCFSNQLSSLDVSANTDLSQLMCLTNELSSLDVSENTALTVLNCSENQLSSLNVSTNTALTGLGCESNELSSLDVSANTALEYLDCSDNQLASLDVSANTALTVLKCRENQLSSLDVSANTALTVLYCNDNQLSSLDVRNGNNANLTYFNATGNSDLSCIYVDDNTVSYSSWEKDETATYVNDEAGCTIANSTYVPDDNFEQALIDLGYDSGDLDDYVLTANISGRTYLDVSSKSISDLTGIEDFAALIHLECKLNELSSLDLSKNTDLLVLFCNDNQLTSLDVSANTALIILYCHENELSSLDVSANTALNELICQSNELSSLDVSANTALTYLFCNDNQLSSLDVSVNADLIVLDCQSNELSSLDIRNGNNANLDYFYATSNPDLSCIYVDYNTAYNYNWYKDETASYVNYEAECTALAVSGLKNVSDEKTSVIAVDGLEEATNLSVYPNPVSDQFTIQTNNTIESLKLYAISGKLVKEFDVQDTYSISGLPAGVYYLNISCEEETLSHKLLIE